MEGNRRLEKWQQTYLAEKGVYLKDVPEDIKSKVNKVTNVLQSNRSFVLLVVKNLNFSKRLIDGVCFNWVVNTGLGFTVVDNITNNCFDDDYINKLSNSSLLIVRYDSGMGVNQTKAVIVENMLMKRYNQNLPTIIELLLVPSMKLTAQPFFKYCNMLSNVFFTKSNRVKILEVRRSN